MKKILCSFALAAVSFALHAQTHTINESQRRVGINNAAPSYTLHIKHGENAPQDYGNDGVAITNTGSGNTWVMHVSNGDKSLQFSRDNALEFKIMPDGELQSISDSTRKTNIAAMPNGQLDKIMQLQAKQYYFKNQTDDKLNYGFLAQEANAIYPDVVSREVDANGKETWTMSYTSLIPFMVKAMQEQQNTISQKDAEIAQLKQQQDMMLRRLEQLEANVRSMEQAQASKK